MDMAENSLITVMDGPAAVPAATLTRIVCASFCACLRFEAAVSLSSLLCESHILQLFVGRLLQPGGLTGGEWLSLLCGGGLPPGVKPSAALISVSSHGRGASALCVCVYSFSCPSFHPTWF